MAMEFDLIPPDTRVEPTATAPPSKFSASATRTFFCLMLITDQIEQESVDVSIWGSADGENWGTHPILKLPQRFYRGETRAVLDLALSSGSEIHPRALGTESLGPRRSDADVRPRTSLVRNSCHAQPSESGHSVRFRVNSCRPIVRLVDFRPKMDMG